MDVVAGPAAEIVKPPHASFLEPWRHLFIDRSQCAELDVSCHGYTTKDRHDVMGRMLRCFDKPERLSAHVEQQIPLDSCRVNELCVRKSLNQCVPHLDIQVIFVLVR